MQGVVIPISMVPGDSYIHRINPLPKLIWVVGYLVLAFATRNPAVLLSMTLLGLVFVTISQVWQQYLLVMRILLPVSLMLIVLQSIAPAFPQPWEPITTVFGVLTIYQEGIYSGISLLLRITSVTTIAMVMIMTSHPSDLFTSLQKIGMPYVMNFILTMTLQLIPILQQEFNIVLNAQKSRGMKGTGFSAVLPSMVPVFVGAIERVQQLSISLESRAFGSAGDKTSYRDVAVHTKDYVVGLLGVLGAAGGLIWLITDKSLDWSHSLTFHPAFAITLFVGSFLGFAAFVVIMLVVIMKA
ncbi:MAG: energy-coupling factor transporter transmembrane protein EcfT [Anaerolineaceae bacterium]|nr:energy-coupling factor transporter transmembrane protein EcfT [Anaerolineaceae bacterium]